MSYPVQRPQFRTTGIEIPLLACPFHLLVTLAIDNRSATALLYSMKRNSRVDARTATGTLNRFSDGLYPLTLNPESGCCFPVLGHDHLILLWACIPIGIGFCNLSLTVLP